MPHCNAFTAIPLNRVVWVVWRVLQRLMGFRCRALRVLQHELAYTLHRPVRRRFPTLPVLVHGPNEQWAADLIETATTARWNKGTRYLLAIIDVFSKRATVLPLRNKRGPTVAQALATLLDAASESPQRLQTDLGTEFYNPAVRRVLTERGIRHFSTSGDAKASVVERFNRTFKDRLYRYFTTHNTLVYGPVLGALVAGYNASYHRSIGMAPRDVTHANAPEVWNALYGRRFRAPAGVPHLRVHDTVRLAKKHRPFQKSYLPGWTEEIFRVTAVLPGPVPAYRVAEWDGTPIKGTFYEQDLQKVHVDPRDTYRIEKVVKTQGSRVLVRWKGWPAKYDSWIAKTALRPLRASSSKKTK